MQIKAGIFQNQRDRSSIYFYTATALVFFWLFYKLISIALIRGNSNKVIMESEFSGVLKELKYEKSDIFLLFEKDSIYWSIDNSINYAYKPQDLAFFLKKGDFLRKNKCSDTLYITRAKMHFHFIIGDRNYNDSNRDDEFKKYWRENREILRENNNCN